MVELAQVSGQSIRYRLTRGASSWLEWFKDNWRQSRMFKLLSTLLLMVLLAYFMVWLFLARGLPDANMLLEYEPPLPTMVRGIDGEIVDSYARERRVQLQFKDFPEQLINTYLSAEDKTFWTHSGIDFGGFVGAVIDYVSKIGSGERAVGGSTITQQVAKNILVGDEYSITRKLKEMILARRIEGVLSKEQILELYLNEIPLGRRSFGVQAAARAYYDKDVADLELHEAAFLSILPKAPERYGRPQNREIAIERRNWVLDEMADNGWASQAEVETAKAQPLGLVAERAPLSQVDAAYFMEEVRRQLVAEFGEQAEDGPNSVYAGGLWVRTSLDTELQQAASDALRAALLRYHGNRGWTGPIATIDLDAGSWRGQLQSSFLSTSYKNWRIGVVTARTGDRGTIGFTNGQEAPLSSLPDSLKPGDVIAVEPAGSGFAVRTVPEVSGGFLAQSPETGRVLAMQGGFDQRLNSFNRATQALRQPGSTIKPFVYATGLEHGFTPASMVPDEPYCVYQGSILGEHCFRNFGGQGGSGEHTMRWGLEQSRNLMTVHIAADTGMNYVTDTFRRVGIGDYDSYLSFALGAGDTTVANMVNAYSALANHGLQHPQTVIDFVQDRHGKVIWRADNRKCTGCNMDEWDGKPMPRFKQSGKQVMDPRTAFQVVYMLQGVVQRGTAVRLRDLDL
ncbi:MAG TPA: transglycosylase domain-containing protein, partial [Sphingomonadaceae bacterium]|nr:transglycosylase domain-containing protein [Sphingomonadaceae bacterium]